MNLDAQTLKTPKPARNSERIGADLTDVTILSTPRPQASSTVERRSYSSRFKEKDLPFEYRQYDLSPRNSGGSAKTSESSLGILDNLSSFLSDSGDSGERKKPNFSSIVDERELARKLLQRCSDIHLSHSSQADTNKENNANSPNTSGDRTPSTLLDSGQSFNLTPSVAKERSTLRNSSDKISTTSLQFEPNEITARSSAVSKSTDSKDTQSVSTQSTDGISFGPATAELMAQFDNEEFQSGSQMGSQLLADEISWQQNASYALPVATSTEKEHLELSCFSGIIGDLDLTVESSAGRKVSVGEFFKRKCGNVGDLTELESYERPSFGLAIRSPKRTGQNVPLVDVTATTEDSTDTNEKEDNKMLTSFADQTKEHTLMSLSTIAQALHDIDDGTPRRLVDQLLQAKKQRKKEPKTEPQNLTSDTYTLLMPSTRNSLPVCPSEISKKFEKDSSLFGRTVKLSLDSKTLSEQSAIKYEKSSRHSAGCTELGDRTDSQVDNSYAEILSEISAISEKPKVREMSTINVTNASSQSNDMKNCLAMTQTASQSQRNIVKSPNSPKPRESQVDVKICRDTSSRQNPFPRMRTDSFIKKENTSAHRSALEASVSNSSYNRASPIEHVIIGKNTQELHNCVIGVRREVDVELVNKSQRWIKCSLSLNHIQGDKDNIELEVSPKIMLLPEANKIVKIGVKVFKSGKPIIAGLNVEMSEMTTRATWEMKHVMCFVPEEPNITVSTQSGKESLEFQADSSSKTLSITLENKNNADIELKISIVENDHRSFRLENPTEQMNCRSNEDDSMCIVLKPSMQFKVNVRFNGTHNGDRRKKDSGATAKLLLSVQDREKEVVIKEVPLVGSAAAKTSSLPTERSNDYLRCDTPQHLGSISSPTSPHSSMSNRSGMSGRNSPISSISGGTVAGDVIPIRSTHAALVWNSIKVGKHDTKEFTIRNTSNNKIKLQATIVDNDKSFKFLRERHEVATHIVLGLQRMESRSFSVVFGPNNAGPAAGRIVFKHYEPKRESSEARPTKVIFLYGYGGIGKVEITEAFKDTGGQLWLSLGSLNAGGTLDAKIKLQNTGDLCSYAKVKLTPKAVYPAMVSSWHVDPTELLLGPKEVRWVTLEFRPRKEDLALLKRANVSHVGTLTITHGDEPTRLRIRRLYKKLSQNGQMSGKENEAFRNVVYPICKVFPGEEPISNLSIIRDSVENLGDLCRGVRQHEVMLTMEVNAEESMSILHDNADDSQMFYSLCSDESNVFPATEESFMPSETLMDCTVLNPRIYEDDFAVNPSVVTLTPPSVNEATVMIMSSSNVAQAFETVLSHNEYLSVVPAEGMIPTRRGFPLRIQCKKRLDRNLEATLQIYTSNDKRDVQIRVLLG